jgi:hypothetical protein
MSRHSLPALGLALVVACSSGTPDGDAEGSAEAEEAYSPVPDVPGSGLAPGDYYLAEVGVAVHAEKRDGSPWDEPLPEPDPVIAVRVAGQEVATCEVRDSLNASCRLRVAVALDADTSVEFAVHDADLRSDDYIGHARLAGLTTHGKTGTRLPMQLKGRLSAAYFRLGTPETWFARYQWRFAGLLAGVLVGLALWFGFKPFWLRQPVAAREEDQGPEQGPEPAESPPTAVEPPAPAASPPAPQPVFRVVCGSCGATSTSAHEFCEYCNAPLREEVG